MTTLLLIISLLCQPLDIIVIGDMSGSVQGHEGFVRDAFHQFIYQPVGNKVGFIRFGNSAELVHHLSDDGNSLLQSLLLIDKADGTTNLSDALYMAIDEFTANGRRSARKMVIIISDGRPDNPIEPPVLTDMMKLDEIDVFCVVINSDNANFQYMETLGISFQTDYHTLIQTLKEINFCL